MIVEVLCADIRFICKLLVVHRLEIHIEGIGNIRALYFQDKLALLHVVVEPGLDVDDAATGKRNDGHFAGDIRIDRAGDIQLSVSFGLLGRDQFELLRPIDGDEAHVAGLDDLSARRRAIRRIELFFASNKGKACGQTCGGLQCVFAYHWITSRPTARFSWAAAVK